MRKWGYRGGRCGAKGKGEVGTGDKEEREGEK